MNFSYLRAFPNFKKLYEFCMEAEEFVITKPSISAVSARKALEYMVKFMYLSQVPYANEGLTVFEMVNDPLFKDYIGDDTVLGSIHYIRKMGNAAAHDSNLSQTEGLKVLEELHFLVGEFCILLGVCTDYPQFEKPMAVTHTVEEEKKAAEKVKVEPEPELMAKFASRMRNTKFQVKSPRDEEENKKMFLHASLREAGWPIVNHEDQAMPSSVGINMLLDDGTKVDYILYGKDNRPLALVEYASTKSNLIEGRMNGLKKAEQLSQKIGYKPVVYYTNGYSIFVIDQLGYPPRRVFQFHSIEELELLKLRKTMRVDISNPTIDDSITNRYYQKEAIKATCQAFSENRRRSLLVMATGTGKTRVSISLVDVLMKANWIKNVLFLADRTSLVRQAHKNFTKLLPSVTTSVYSGGSMNRDANARVIFSTYQTMINLINDDTREFGIGRFDLIIIDEAHRSIFKKYSALFRYFDSLMIGLTATPRNEENKSTYEMFKLKNGHPDYAYELEQAIHDKFLVGFSVFDKTTKVLQRGACYDDLSEEEKNKFEEEFALDDVAYAKDIFEADRNRRIINLGTIDSMLNDLMKNGLKINGGDKIGKTIIFADSHLQAEKIVERFQILYSYLGSDFCKLIDSKVDNNLELIDSFGERDNMPQIAVSVDMMDTGIDVPDVLNLVFFKPVHSKIKFLQMIGRGTRLSPDVFGPTVDKKGFYIFDYYDNFRYFKSNNTWDTVNEDSYSSWATIAFGTPQSVLINQRKVRILSYLQKSIGLSKYDEDYKKRLKDYFVSAVRGLCNDDIEVQYNMAYVNKYRKEEAWDGLISDDRAEILAHILPLLPPERDPAKVKMFDLMMYIIEDEVPRRIEGGKDARKIKHGFGNVFNKIDSMLMKLLKLSSIPAIQQKEVLITQMLHGDYLLDNFSYERCEAVRLELRDLMQFIPDSAQYYVINMDDMIIESDNQKSGIVEKSYSEKVMEYIQKGSPTLSKMRNLDELTEEEKLELETVFKQTLGSDTDYVSWSDNKPLLPFLRVQVGISDEAIQTKFGTFLNEQVMNEQQLTYLQQIISYVRENGDITFMDLQRVSPFCDVDIMDLFGQLLIHIKTLINGLHKPVM